MARPRFLVILLAGALSQVFAPGPSQMHAQSAQTSAPSYDDLAAAARRAEAEKEAAAQKHGKKSKAEPAALPATSAAATPEPPPAPEPATASPVAEALSAAAPAATEKASAEPSAAAAPPATDPQPASPAPTDATAAPAADGTVPSATAAAAGDKEKEEADADNPDGAMPKVAPKMQRTLFGKMKPVKEKAPKLVPITIVHGELTVDGLIAKAGLNFQIADMKYFYIWVPGLGTTIVSNQPFPGSQIQESALNGSLLTVSVEGHQLQLACDRDLLGGKKPKPISVFVALDKNFDKASIYPEFGYGTALKAPYSWPGTLADLHPNTKAPPLPVNLRQNTESIKTCHKNEDGTTGPCRTVEVPMVLGKTS